ncbi:uncharacterized protein LOC120076142 [Benincasa hispida]|uniref:uncharacterized protein LOC120076142 n=1 Tax=Benincasa hispida TaxID=102211 RepID=UPI00190126BE|nr:uncharacterized protein LOC120076142 [Benincasa hispida]
MAITMLRHFNTNPLLARLVYYISSSRESSDLRFVLNEEYSPTPSSSVNRNVRDAYGRWVRVNEKAGTYILISISDILTKKHERMVTAKGIMDSLHAVFGQPSSSVRHDTLKEVYNYRIKEGTFVREHVMDMGVEVNSAVRDKKVEKAK